MRAWISSDALAAIQAHARADSDREVCGLLLGQGLEIYAVRPAANVADTPVNRFEIDPAALLAAHREGRSGGLRLIGYYHSHPAGEATPSDCDAAMAPPDGMLWLIHAAGESRLWQATESGAVHGRFDPVELDVKDT